MGDHKPVYVAEGSGPAPTRTSLSQLVSYRETVWAFASRGVRVRYKQSALGAVWAVAEPLAFLAVFVVFFGRVARISGGGVPYAAFALSALVPWHFASSAITFGANALVADASLLRKVWFPRAAPVLGAIGSWLPDLAIGLVLLAVMAPLTGAHIGVTAVWALLLAASVVLPVVAVTVPLAALSVYYRDFRHALPFAMQLWLLASPVAYPLTRVPPGWRVPYALANPLVGPLEGFRRVLAAGLGPDWGLLLASTASSVVLLVAGYRVFSHLERDFADVA